MNNQKLTTAVSLFGSLMPPEEFIQRFAHFGATKSRLYSIQREANLENWTEYRRRMKNFGLQAMESFHETNVKTATQRFLEN